MKLKRLAKNWWRYMIIVVENNVAHFSVIWFYFYGPLGWSRSLATSVESLAACNIIPEWSCLRKACGVVSVAESSVGRCKWDAVDARRAVVRSSMQPWQNVGKVYCFRQWFSPTCYQKPHQTSPEHRADIPVIHYCFRFLITVCIW